MVQEQFDHLQKKYNVLVEKVQLMRKAQNDYFRLRSKSDLNRARTLERQVDDLTRKAKADAETNQRELFQ